MVGLVGVQAALLLLTLATRRRVGVQTALFVVFGAAIFSGEHTNRALGQHWERFASQNYFDKQGLFFSVMFSGPLLVDIIAVQINLVVLLARDVVKLKRMELRRRARAQQAAEKKEQ